MIISFSPEEKVTAEQAMYVLEHFAKDVLGDDYEAVYAVHTDREHMHGHLIWNSVSMTTGKKYNSPKGNWKNHLQPITNKYCDELGLSIMPAEYSRNPKNISRDKWEKEMSMKEIILRDAKMCAYAAGNVEHFKYLMKRLGYVFKKDAWMEVQAPGFRYYHKLAKLDEMFSEDMLRHHVDMPWMAKPYFYSSDIRGLHRAKLSPFQKKFYAKLYRLRVVEQKRFVVGGAKYAEDLKRFHQLQDEYLLIVNNDIKSVVDLVDFISEQEEKIQQIEDRQHEIYRESSSRKRSIKNEEQYREYQMWHVEVQEELDAPEWFDAQFTGCDAIVPRLNTMLTDVEDLPRINELAQSLQALKASGQLTKFKAVVDATQCESLDDVFDRIEKLPQYCFETKICDKGALVRDELEFVLGGKDADLIYKHLNREAYAEDVLKQYGAELTAYGMVNRADFGPLHEPIPEQQQEQTLEPQMGM